MALPAVLSALRFMIMDEANLPDDVPAREKLLTSKIKGLTKEELEDLAKIPSGKLAIYTNSIFTAEASIIQRNFPLTLALLGRALNQKIVPYNLAKEVHKVAHWSDIHSPALGRSLFEYLKQNKSTWSEKEPAILDACRIELLSLEIRKEINGELLPSDGMPVSDLLQLTVDKLLTIQFFVPDSVRAIELEFDLLKARSIFYASDEETVISPEKKIVYALGGRPVSYGASWVECANGLKELVLYAQQEREVGWSLEQLALAFLEECPSSNDESVAFSLFLEKLRELVDAGVVILKPDGAK